METINYNFKTFIMKKIIYLALLFILPLVSCTKDEPGEFNTVSFEDISLSEKGYKDAELGGSFKSNEVIFYSNWVTDFGGYSNGGIYLSKLHDQSTKGISNQYSAYPKPYGNFAVVHYSSFNAEAGNNYARFKLPNPASVKSIDIANSTYVFWTIKTGEDGFGACRAYKEGDWFKVTFTGYDLDGKKTASIDHYLADFRDGKSYIATNWETISLIGLGNNVSSVEISIEGTDIGDYGLNTPTYCCIDNIIINNAYIVK